MRSAQIGTVLAVAALAAAPPVRAQVAPVGVSVQLLNTVEILYASDFSPFNQGQQPDFISIVLQNGSTGPQTVFLEVVIRQEQPRAAQLFTGTSDPFVLQPGVRRITNRDLSNGNSDVVIEDFDMSSDADDIRDQLTQSGRFPAGTYTFRLTVYRAGTRTALGAGQVSLDLDNPSRVELLSPGRPFGESPEVLTNPAPRFNWTADVGLAAAGSRYRLKVAPADGAASPEEAMQQFPAWDATLTATSALYPGSVSARPLEAGKTYAWQVTREVPTSGGSQFIASPIYWFKMAGAVAGSTTEGAAADLGATLQLENLGRALGLGAELSGFKPTGTILVDGREWSAENLEALLRAILAGTVTVRSVTVR